MDIKEKTIARGIAMIEACECQFKVITADGKEYGNLAVKKQPKFRKANNWAKTGYIDRLRDMKRGDVLELGAPAGAEVQKFQSAICGAATSLFGAGNYTTSKKKDGNSVEILRII